MRGWLESTGAAVSLRGDGALSSSLKLFENGQAGSCWKGMLPTSVFCWEDKVNLVMTCRFLEEQQRLSSSSEGWEWIQDKGHGKVWTVTEKLYLVMLIACLHTCFNLCPGTVDIWGCSRLGKWLSSQTQEQISSLESCQVTAFGCADCPLPSSKDHHSHSPPSNWISWSCNYGDPEDS